MEEALSICVIRDFFPDDKIFAEFPVSRLEADNFFERADEPCIAKFIKQTMKNPNVEDVGRIICIAIAYSAVNQWNKFLKIFSVPFLQTFNKLKKINEESYSNYLQIIQKKLQIIWKYPFFWCVHYSHIPNYLDEVNLKIALKDIDFVLLMFRKLPNHQEFKLWTIFYLCHRNKIEKYHNPITDLSNILDKITIETRNFLPYIWMTDRFCRQLDGKDFWNKFFKVDARITMDELKNPVHNYYMSSYVKVLQNFWWKNYESLSDIQRYRIFTIYTPSREEVEMMSEDTKLILIRCLYQGMAKK